MKTRLVLSLALVILASSALAAEWIALEVLDYESYPGGVVIKIKPTPLLPAKLPADCIARIYLEFQNKEVVLVDSSATLKFEELDVDAAGILSQCRKDSLDISSFRQLFDSAKRWEIQPLSKK